ncbi:inactive rhomboid protein [Salix suchowensis]|nr:inactive rhomboid protein [Salix suchowensis]
MEQEEQADYATHLLGSPTVPAQVAQPPSFVTLSPFPPISTPSSRRRISSQFTPSRAVPLTRRLARVSLQGRLVDAEEASSAKAIGLSWEAGVAWELFTPAQRFLIVAVIGVAVSESKKNRIINQLKKSVELRDQVLSSMQQKLDDLCDQLSSIKNQAGTKANASFNNSKNIEPPCTMFLVVIKLNSLTVVGKSAVRMPGKDEVLRCKMPFGIEREPEEQQMSDFSDWGSTGSAEEIQTNTFAIDQDMFNLKKECEEKDATKEELSTDLQSFAGSKRIAELEDIICRKNSMIKRLKRDMVVLEEKADLSARLRRPSYSLSISDNWELPVMVENILYDLDSSSSSDSDSSPSSQPQHPSATIQETSVQSDVLTLTTAQKPAQATASRFSVGLTEPKMKSRSERLLTEITTKRKSIGNSSSRSNQLSAGEDIRRIRRKGGELHSKSRAEIHPKETSRNQKSAGPSASKPEKVLAGGDGRKIRRQTQSSSKDTAPKKRWL